MTFFQENMCDLAYKVFLGHPVNAKSLNSFNKKLDNYCGDRKYSCNSVFAWLVKILPKLGEVCVFWIEQCSPTITYLGIIPSGTTYQHLGSLGP